ncbi:NUDIX domain-containing protein [Polaribacter aestuariivivens]|uniref:NUDIX domain-containing protein n=1 Tax=Polaribacter aestuariivivens TaxID=2304626 RepID=A0A5S3NE27_9FLAO|nr:NUDIX domain-containing protein [Polaribacter aestuariivivens]TMM32029.1 NUDIX domain-containing protein [Polaribacter aestuariivivens]
MYKVFVNDKPIIITSSQKKENNFPVHLLKNTVSEEIVHKLRNGKIKGVNLYTPDLEKGWELFLESFKIVSAAGGLVLNDKKEVLFIFRNGTWDLPKGRIEKGETIPETAVREVEEECGITNLKLVKPLLTTYHIYFEDEIKLKETFWFLMTSDFKGVLTPQLEEGITKVVFKNSSAIEIALQNSYKNIQMVYDSFKEG